MNDIPYIADIRSQPNDLRRLLKDFDALPLASLADAIGRGAVDRIVITGMGASLFGAYPAWLTLVEHGLPAYWIDAAELIHYTPELIGPRTLLWAVSQSGRSAEILSLLAPKGLTTSPTLLATTNDPDSPLAQAAGTTLLIRAQVEQTVSTRTYTNTLAAMHLAALALCGKPIDRAQEQIEAAAAAMEVYLADMEAHVTAIDAAVGLPQRLAVLGRGPSLAAVLTGGLILAEAAKVPALAMNAAEFRHGPLELADDRLTALVFAGPERTRVLNERLLGDLRGYGVNALWLGEDVSGSLPALSMPETQGAGLPLAEILPVQLLTIALARRSGIEPGKFFRSGKVTLLE